MFDMTATDWWQLFDVIARIAVFSGAFWLGALGGIVCKVVAIVVIMFITCGGW